jgi:uncharacterized membrane protein YcaP (DUF421 family)
MSFIWEAITILFLGFCLLRVLGKKTVSEMTGLEIITLLAMASMIGHAIAGDGFGIGKTAVTLSIFVAMLVTLQFLAVKLNWVERWFMGEATLVIKDGQIVPANLHKLRMSVDQLEARLREKGITSVSDIKNATIEMSGQLGYEWNNHARPVTIGDLEAALAFLYANPPDGSGIALKFSKEPQIDENNLFHEVIHRRHLKEIPRHLD